MKTKRKTSNLVSHATLLGRVMLLFAMLTALVFPGATTVKSAPDLVGSIVVNILVDADPYDPNDGACSLREAIEASNQMQAIGNCPAGTGNDLITFSVAGMITFVKEMTIDNTVGIVGPIALSGGGSTRLFVVGTTNSSLGLTNLTIQDGKSSGGGGAILNKGSLGLIGTSFQNNVAKGDGGAIYSQSQVAVLMSTFAGNRAGEGNTTEKSGGAIYIIGSNANSISLSNFNGNLTNGSGGAIAIGSQAEVEISDSIFSGNIAEADGNNQGGGAIYNESDEFDIIRSAFNGNLSPSGGGGALYNTTNGTIDIEDSSFNGNISGDYDTNGQGGAIHNFNDMTITRATFNGNIASLVGEGGGIFNDKVGNLAVTNSTFFANTALVGKGGAIYNTDTNQLVSKSVVTLRNVTLTDNVAAEGEAIYNIKQSNQPEEVNLYNTIIESTGGQAACAGGGDFIDGGGNLQYPDTSCGAAIVVADPLTDAPTYNGGAIVSLLTIALQDGSPAIDAANNSVCAAAPVNNEDQRGEARPKDGNGDGNPVCDVGAMEADEAKPGYGSTPVQPGPVQFGSAIVNTTINASFEVFETGNTILSVSAFSLSGQHASDFVVNTPPFDIADGGAAVTVDLACTPSEVGERTATLTVTTNDPDHPGVDYQLLCTGTENPEPGYGSNPPAPGPVEFGNVVVGVTQSASFEVFEVGTDALVVESPLLGGVNPGDFSLTTLFPITINDGGAAQTVDLDCTPSEPGIRTATLTLTTNDPNKPSVIYNLTCNGYIPPNPPLDIGPTAPGAFLPYDIAITPDGQLGYVTSPGTGDVKIFTRTAATGELTLISAYSHADLVNPMGVEISPDGKHVFVTGEFSDSLVILERDPDTGIVSTFQVVKDGDLHPPGCTYCVIVNGLNGADGLDLSPDGKNVYVAGSEDNGISIFRREVPTGTVRYAGSMIEGDDGVTGLVGARDVVVSPDGNHVYAVSDNGDAAGGAVVLFQRTPSGGYLTFVEAYQDGGDQRLDGASAVAVSPDGTQVFVTAWDDATLSIFNRNLADGRLTLSQRFINAGFFQVLDGANGVTVSPDGLWVYVSSSNDDTLIVFARDPLTGQVTFKWVYRDNINGVDGLDGARKVITSAGGGHVYVTGYFDHLISVFAKSKPIPLLTSLDPSSVQVGSAGLTLRVYGEDFSPDTIVRVNGGDRETTYVSSTELQTELLAADLGVVASLDIEAYTPPPGGGTSNKLTFEVLPLDGNPIPMIRSIDPKGANAGDPAFTLLVNGSGFMSDSVVQWNGADRETTFVSGCQLMASILVTDIAAPGSAGVTVFTPGPGGGTSNAVMFSIASPGENPVPSIRSLSPASTYETGAFGGDLIVTVNGANFTPDSTVYWNGTLRITDYVDTSQLEVTLTAGDTAFAGDFAVTVDNPAPGGGTSNIAIFQVMSSDQNLIPAITNLELAVPSSGTEAGNTIASVDAFDLVVEGTGFAPGAEVYLNGELRPTTFISATQLRAALTSADLDAGRVSVQVVNPPPGGGPSNMVLYPIQILRIYLPFVLK